MKLWFNSLGSHIIGCIDRIKSIHEDPLLRHFKDDSSQFDLTPAFIEEKDENGNANPKYEPVKDIANKLGNRNVKNIALTGPYGAGKSSVLQTLMRDYRKAKYLSISLATLEDDTLYKELIEKEKTTNNDEAKELKAPIAKSHSNEKQEAVGKDAINHLIEYSILQQIIYKEKAHKLRQSRLKRIQDIKWKKALPISASLIIAVIAAIVLFMPEFIMVDSLCEVFSCSEEWKQIWDVICLIYLIIISVYFLSYIIISTYNSKINKLNFKNGEIDIKENTSIFNKHLDEIIYFFEVTKYNVVIIEDLDRFDTNHIFLKLREINQLLNASNSIGRRIVFIYAVRDDIFHDTNRTKFFDYITTVIPVVNSSNACDKLISALQEKGVNEISETTCKELGFYIDDMRILYNIVDEYLQYRTKIGEKISPKNLLGMIVYKNYFPKDFADLHNRKGVVYTIISNKQKYIEEISVSQKQKIKETEDVYYTEKENYKSFMGKELRTLYVVEYLKKNPRICKFVDGSNSYSIKDIINDEKKFNKLVNNEIKRYEYYYNYNYTNTEELKINFKDIENLVDAEHGYFQRLNYETEILAKKREEIENMRNSITKYQQMTLAELVKIPTIKSFHTDISLLNDKTKLVEFLLKEGYINEFYYDYISYFYPGTLMPEDKDYIADLRIGNKKEYTYQLCKFESVIEVIPAKSYNNGGVLNVSLVKYMSDHIDDSEISSKLDKIIKYIVNKKEKEFVLAFYKIYADCSVLFERLFAKWTRFDIDCIYEGKERDRNRSDIFFEIFLRYVDFNTIEKENEEFDIRMCDNFRWINERLEVIGLKRVIDVTQKRNLKYYSLSANTLSPDLMSYVIDGCHYKRRADNLLSIVSFLAPDKIASYRIASMTTIREIGNTDVMDDMDNNMDEYIQCFPESSKEETEDNLLCIVNTCQVNDKTKEYLRKQTNKIDILSDIPDNERKIMSISTNIIKPKWKNVEEFVNAEDDNINMEELVQYIEMNIDELCSVKATSVLSEEIKSRLFIHFVGTNILSYASYRKFRDSFWRIFTEYDLSGLESKRMSYLIETKGIKFNEFYYKFISENYPQLINTFVINNKADYLKDLSLYPLSSDTAEGLLKASSFKKDEKAQVIYSLPDSFSVSTSLANYICQFFINGNLDKLRERKDAFINYLSASDNIELKVKAFMYYVDHQDINDVFIKEALKTMGTEYAEIAMQKGFRPKLSKGYYNKELILYLLNRKFISTYKEEEKYYQINTRNLN